MTASTPDRNQQNPFEGQEFGGLPELLADVDATHETYLQTCRDFAAKARDTAPVETALTAHSTAFQKFLAKMLPGSGCVEYRQVSVHLLADLDSRRADGLNEILGEEVITKTVIEEGPDDGTDTELGMDRNEINHAKAQTLTAIVNFQRRSSTLDTQLFFDSVREARANRNRFRQELGKHALDVGKAALGSAIGAIVGVWFMRRKRN